MQHRGGSNAPSRPPPALAYWLPVDAWRVVRATAERTLTGLHAAPAVRGALTELDAAAVRSRWFDHPAAAAFRRIAGHPPDAVTIRLTAAEHAALVACDPELIGPLLDQDTHPVPAPASVTGPAEPFTPPAGPAGPVVVLDHDRTGLRWAVAEYDGMSVTTSRPSPGAAIWTTACETARHEPVDVDAHGTARRLVAKAHPALSSLALARPDFRPHPGEAVLLRLPDLVVVAPSHIAARVVTYAAPSLVTAVPADALPAEPTPASTVS